MTHVDKNCLACGDLIKVRLADHKRGWGKFCDKSCSAAFKGGMRPRDVNASCAKYSPWAKTALALRQQNYGGGHPPKAPSIKEQTGRKHRIKAQKRKQVDCLDPRDDPSSHLFDPLRDEHPFSSEALGQWCDP